MLRGIGPRDPCAVLAQSTPRRPGVHAEVIWPRAFMPPLSTRCLAFTREINPMWVITETR